MAANKTWKEKCEEANAKGGVTKPTKKGLMYISTPKEIKKIIRRVPEGKLITTKLITNKLSKKHRVDFTCPLTTGIFSSLVANAAEEARAEGEKKIIPYWRVVKAKGKLYEHYLRQFHPQRELLQAEGFDIEEGKGKQPPNVKDFEQYLVG